MFLVMSLASYKCSRTAEWDFAKMVFVVNRKVSTCVQANREIAGGVAGWFY